MAIDKSRPMRFTPKGLTDAYDSTDEFPGACQQLQNFVFDQSNPEIIVARPGVRQLVSFAPAGFLNPGFVSIQVAIGNIIFGLLATGRNAGKDEPFVFNTTTGTFVPLTGVTFPKCPFSPPTTGDWTPPTMANIGTMVIVTHPGFVGTVNKFGWFDITNPAAPTWNAGDTATNGLPGVPSAVANFFNRAYFSFNNLLPYTDVLTNPPTRTNASQSLTIGDTTGINTLVGLPVQTTSSGVVQALYVFKQTQCWQVTGDTVTANLALNFVSLTIGTNSPRSVVQSTTGIYFSGTGGPYFIDALGTLRALTYSADQLEPDIQVPFQNAITPTRWAAAYSSSVYRVCGPTQLKGNQVSNDYWFDEHRRRWNGPHTYAYDCASALGRNYVLSSVNNPGLLIISEPQSNIGTSVFDDLGTTYQCNLLSSTFPKTSDMLTKQVAESQIELEASLGLSSYTVQAQNEQGTVMGTVLMENSSGGAEWGAFVWGDGTRWARAIVWGGGELWGDAAHFGSGNIWLSSQQIPVPYAVSWAAPLVFEKMQLSVSVTASAFVGVGTFYARYQETGYMVPTSIAISSVPGATGFPGAPGTGGPGTGGVLDGIAGITVQEEGVAVGDVARIKIVNFTGGTVTASGTGVVATVNVSAGAGNPAAPDTSVQFNNGGVFGGSPHLVWSTPSQALELDTNTAIFIGQAGSIQMGFGTTILQGDSWTQQMGLSGTLSWGTGLTWSIGQNLIWTVDTGASITIGANSFLALGFTSTFTLAQGSRITGDFSNATHGNRVLFQTTTVNGNTIIGVIPNGASTTATALYYQTSNPNAANNVCRAGQSGTVSLLDASVINGATQGTLELRINGAAAVAIDTAKNAQFKAGMSVPVASKTANYTILQTDATLFGDCTGGSFTFTLPAANVAGAGFSPLLRIKRSDSSGNTITIARAGADTIDGGTTFVLGAKQGVVLVSDSVSNWGIV